MNPVQARMIIEQILSMPVPQASQYIQSNIQFLDNTFFMILNQMIQEEQKSSQFGNRIGALQGLYAYTTNLRQQMVSQSSYGQSAAIQPEQVVVTCAACRQTSYVICPGFGKHIASPTVVQSPNGPQCALCGVTFSSVTCNCGHVTYFTPTPSNQAGKEKTKTDTMFKELEPVIRDLINAGALESGMMDKIREAMNDPEKLEALFEELKATSESPLKIEDFYREAPGKFNLQWPLNPSLTSSNSLPAPFDELDRKTQFYVLFTEWTRREMEGMTALNRGQVDQAEEIFKECIQRAEQIEVRELIARSYEGLMRVANKRSDRESELKWSEKAMEARAG